MKQRLALTLGTLLMAGASVASASVSPPLECWQVWPTDGVRILPSTPPPQGGATATVDFVSAPGLPGAFSFAVRASQSVTALAVKPEGIATAEGVAFPASAIDLRVVKSWLQDANAWMMGERAPGAAVLVPELLLHDDSLVKVDRAAGENLVRAKTGDYRRIKASESGATTPADAGFVAADDAAELKPVDLAAGETRQFVALVDVPADARPGLYHGRLVLSAGGKPMGDLAFSMRLVGHGVGPCLSRFSWSPVSDGRLAVNGGSPAVLKAGKGERYRAVAALPEPLLSPEAVAWLAKWGAWEVAVPPSRLADVAGLFGGKVPEALWVADAAPLEAVADIPSVFRGLDVHAATNAAPFGRDKALAAFALPDVAKAAEAVKTGASDVRFFLPVPASRKDAAAVRQVMEAVCDAGAKVWAFSNADTFAEVPDLVEAPMQENLCRPTVDRRTTGGVMGDCYGDDEFSPTLQLERWHALGLPGYLFEGTAAGVENPGFWRRRLGLECFQLGFDGVVLPRLVEAEDPWNDWASPSHRSRTFLYPTEHGFIPTLQWLGVAEGLADARCLSEVVRTALALRYAAKGEFIYDVEGRKAAMFVDWLMNEVTHPDTMRLDAFAWLERLDAVSTVLKGGTK